MTACLIALAILFGSAVVALFAGRRSIAVGAAGLVLAAIAGLPGAIGGLAGEARELALPWAEPIGELRLGVDPLSAFFIIPLLVIAAGCGVYGAFYLEGRARSLAVPTALFNALAGAMLLVLLARDAIVFVIAWEVMTLASFALVTYDHALPEVRRAGWVYLVASHVGIACVLCAFVLLGERGFSFGDLAARGNVHAPVAAVLATIGFGVKAGVVPLHVWLPEAHAAAPSHVSALMSAVLIKLGVYGIARTIVLVPSFPWGATLSCLGVVGAFVGIALAFYQRDLKRALAYSSIENIGIVLIGLGLGMWGHEHGRPAVAALGLAGGLLHIWSHALAKSVLFLGAGALVHGSGTRDLEQMGGLAKRMPRTSSLLVLGGVAIAGLPPLGAFASEWLVYLGLARGATQSGSLSLLFAIAALATAGVMATVCFVRIVGIALLGHPRTEAAARAHEVGRGMLAPPIALAALAVALPFLAPLVVHAIAPVIEQLGPEVTSEAMSGAAGTLEPIAILGGVLWLGGIAMVLAIRALVRRRRTSETWGCGYTAPTPRMQYSAASFADGLHRLLPRGLRARVDVAPPVELFPSPAQLAADRRDPFTRAAYEPLLDRIARRFGQLRWVQQGLLHLYLLYIVLAVVLGLAFVSLRGWSGP